MEAEAEVIRSKLRWTSSAGLLNAWEISYRPEVKRRRERQAPGVVAGPPLAAQRLQKDRQDAHFAPSSFRTVSFSSVGSWDFTM